MLYFFSSQMFPLLSFSSIALSAKIYNELLSVFTFFTTNFRVYLHFLQRSFFLSLKNIRIITQKSPPDSFFACLATQKGSSADDPRNKYYEILRRFY